MFRCILSQLKPSELYIISCDYSQEDGEKSFLKSQALELRAVGRATEPRPVRKHEAFIQGK